MATIPELREALAIVAANLTLHPGDAKVATEAAETIRWAVSEMHRRTYVRKARPRSPPITPDKIIAIRAYAEQHRDANYMQIANAFQVSIGRVSEALGGKRT
ncbi:hypothetical protein [Planktothrix phage Pra-JY27]|nr:tetratricopeptide repeat domain protein [Planktothrix phage Pag-Yong1]WEV89217.1 hypothetical protein [Synechococcus phage MinM2]